MGHTVYKLETYFADFLSKDVLQESNIQSVPVVLASNWHLQFQRHSSCINISFTLCKVTRDHLNLFCTPHLFHVFHYKALFHNLIIKMQYTPQITLPSSKWSFFHNCCALCQNVRVEKCFHYDSRKKRTKYVIAYWLDQLLAQTTLYI